MGRACAILRSIPLLNTWYVVTWCLWFVDLIYSYMIGDTQFHKCYAARAVEIQKKRLEG